ncbi:hypothetical protein KY289_003243 [Solanum tuberosum]|nr:hypothetical protein KY289_003243 [Solanum tuberosum]
MENSNLDEQHTEVEVSLEESDREETRQIVSEIGVGNSRDPYIGKEFQSLDDSFKFYPIMFIVAVLVYARSYD